MDLPVTHPAVGIELQTSRSDVQLLGMDGMVWYGMAWHGVAWHGVVWYSLV